MEIIVSFIVVLFVLYNKEFPLYIKYLSIVLIIFALLKTIYDDLKNKNLMKLFHVEQKQYVEELANNNINKIEYIFSYTSIFTLYEEEIITIPINVFTNGGKKVRRLLICKCNNKNINIENIEYIGTNDIALTVKGINAGTSTIEITTENNNSFKCCLYWSIQKYIEVQWLNNRETFETFNTKESFDLFIKTNQMDIKQWKNVSVNKKNHC